MRICSGGSIIISFTDVHITLIGNGVSSSRDDVHIHLGHKDMCYDDIILECNQTLGKVQVVAIENNKPLGLQHYVHYVEVHDLKSSVKQVFPFYHWIEPKHSVCCSSSSSMS